MRKKLTKIVIVTGSLLMFCGCQGSSMKAYSGSEDTSQITEESTSESNVPSKKNAVESHKNKSPITYKIVKKNDYSKTLMTRMRYTVLLKTDHVPSETELKKIAFGIMEDDNRRWDRLVLHIYLPEMNDDAAFAVFWFQGRELKESTINEYSLYGTKWWAILKKAEPCENKPAIPVHEFVYSRNKRSQLRAIATKGCYTKKELMDLAVTLAEQHKPFSAATLVQFFSDTNCLNGWDGTGTLRESDWPHWMCRISIDTDNTGKLYARTFKLAIDQQTGITRKDVLKN